MNLYWLEQVEANVPVGTEWLSPWEITRLDGFHFAKRRADWRLGRWTAKQALAFCLNLSFDADALATIEIRPAVTGVPEAFVANRPAPIALSLSHRQGRAMCVIGPADLRVGCDLESIEIHGDAFVADYFTPEEQQWVTNSAPEDRNRIVALLWSAKESALKALHEGLRLDTRAITANFEPEWPQVEGWGQLQVRYGDDVFRGWWQATDCMVRTIAADATSSTPICLPVASVLDTGLVPQTGISVR